MMTKEEINDISDKYCLVIDSEFDSVTYSDFLKWLQKDYSIINKQAIRALYKNYQDDLVRFAGSGDTFRLRTKAILTLLEQIFGVYLFKDLKK